MRVFVTGASGWIGSAVAAELISAGHEVIGLARSASAASRVAGLGAEVHRGDLDDVVNLGSAAARADAVVHLGYNHNFADMEGAARTDLLAIEALGGALEGTGRPLVIAAGTLGLAPGRVATERDSSDTIVHPRAAGSQAALAFSDKRVRSVVVRFAPTVHGSGDHGFVSTLVNLARDKGVSAYIGDGANRWPAVHRMDAAALVRLAVEGAPAGSVLHAVAEEGIATRSIADAIGRGLRLPVASVPAEAAVEHFGWLARFFGADSPASHDVTSDLLGWTPTQPELLVDLAAGHYFEAPTG